MDKFIFRAATVSDIPFLVTTIIEAEKSGTDKLPYSTIFGLTEEEVRVSLEDILLEEIDGCELSLSSFIVAESDGQTAGALSAWIEGDDGIPSTVVKGNLLHHILPKKCLERGFALNAILYELHIKYVPGTIQIGAIYVAEKFRGFNLSGLLTLEMISRLTKNKPELKAIYSHVFSCNEPALRANEKLNYKVVQTLEATNEEILNYLPSNKKFEMKKDLTTN